MQINYKLNITTDSLVRFKADKSTQNLTGLPSSNVNTFMNG